MTTYNLTVSLSVNNHLSHALKNSQTRTKEVFDVHKQPMVQYLVRLVRPSQIKHYPGAPHRVLRVRKVFKPAEIIPSCHSSWVTNFSVTSTFLFSNSTCNSLPLLSSLLCSLFFWSLWPRLTHLPVMVRVLRLTSFCKCFTIWSLFHVFLTLGLFPGMFCMMNTLINRLLTIPNQSLEGFPPNTFIVAEPSEYANYPNH